MAEKNKFVYILACGDPKIRTALMKLFDKRFGPESYFWLPELGGVKNLVSPGKKSDAEYIIRKMKIAALVHPFTRIILINHSDCGAYRLAGQSFAEAKKEKKFHRAELHKAAAAIKKEIPTVKAEIYYFLKNQQKMAW